MRSLLVAVAAATVVVAVAVAVSLTVRTDPIVETVGFSWSFGMFADKKINFALGCARLEGQFLESSHTGKTLVFSKAKWDALGAQRQAEIKICLKTSEGM